MSSKRYMEELKMEAVKQVTERGHPLAEASGRIGVSQHSLHARVKRYSQPFKVREEQQSQSVEIRRRKAELKRVTEERDILKRPRRTLQRSPGKVCLVT